MRLSEREFLIMSMLAYLNFEKKHLEKELLEILKNRDIKPDENENMKILKGENLDITLDFFREDLKGWKVLHIENRRALSKSIFSRNDKTGFYSVSFQKEEKVIIAYRGSETYPIEEAYKDFVENNFALGIGKRPKQFNDAAYVVDYHIKKLDIPIENLAITGHSLGGGLAQFAALYCHKTHGKIPVTSTWNAVGINRGGVIQMQDFIDFDEILLTKLNCSKKMVEVLRPIRDEYLNMLNEYNPDEEEEFISLLEKNSRVKMILEGLIRKIYLNTDARKEFLESFVSQFFRDKEILEKIFQGKQFIKNIQENSIYGENIKNFGHSEDLTNIIFNHVGDINHVDLKKTGKKRESSVVKSLFSIKKAAVNYHFEDVFIPYLKERGEEEMFSSELNPDYMASSLRMAIYNEKGFSNDLLASYYSCCQIDSQNFGDIRSWLVEGLKKSNKNIIYRDEIILVLENMETEKF
ncbi:MAG: hypothetical protein ACRC4Z_06400 [Fusobacteriaceae bacterium]